MAKVIKGTKNRASAQKMPSPNSQYRVVKGQKDTRQVRCPGCKELASQVPDGKGGTIYQCVCGRRFTFAAM